MVPMQAFKLHVYETIFVVTYFEVMFLDIEQIKSNILDNLPEILDVMSVAALQTPFVSAGIMSYEELDLLHMNSESVRTENLHFVRMVLHRGDEAVRIFLVALENSIGMDNKRLLNTIETLQVGKGKAVTKIIERCKIFKSLIIMTFIEGQVVLIIYVLF